MRAPAQAGSGGCHRGARFGAVVRLPAVPSDAPASVLVGIAWLATDPATRSSPGLLQPSYLSASYRRAGFLPLRWLKSGDAMLRSGSPMLRLWPTWWLKFGIGLSLGLGTPTWPGVRLGGRNPGTPRRHRDPSSHSNDSPRYHVWPTCGVRPAQWASRCHRLVPTGPRRPGSKWSAETITYRCPEGNIIFCLDRRVPITAGSRPGRLGCHALLLALRSP